MTTVVRSIAGLGVLMLLAPVSVRAGADEGKALYAKKCRVCHSIGDDAGKLADKGGALDGVGSTRDAAWLEAYLRDPKATLDGAKMPKMKLTDQELQDLVAYMRTLQNPPE